MGSLQFVSNVIFGKVLLGEHVTRRIVLATLAVIFGNCFIVIFSAVASAKTQEHSVNQILSFYTAPGNLAYLSVISVLLVLLVWAYLQLIKINRHAPPHAQSDCAAAIQARKRSISGFVYVLISALVGTQGIIQAKCFSELMRELVVLHRALDGPDAGSAALQIRRAQHALPLVVLVWVACSGFWLWRMTAALRRYEGLFIIPVIQLCWTCLAIVGGGIFFQEFVLFSAAQWVGFAVGLAFVFAGVWVLMSDRERAGRKVAARPQPAVADVELGLGGDVDLGSLLDNPAPLPRLHRLAFHADEVPLRYRPPVSPDGTPEDDSIFNV